MGAVQSDLKKYRERERIPVRTKAVVGLHLSGDGPLETDSPVA